MFRMMIVDDEPAIVNGMVKLFAECESFELDVLKAYSAFDAIEIMKNTKVDIVLSDIRMPGMNGLEMLDHILYLWPNCKVIFLTGYSEFDYLYEAIHRPGVNYLLKTECDEVILAAVSDAIEVIKHEREQKNLLIRAKSYMEERIPLIRKELFESVLYGESMDPLILGKRFDELNIKFDFQLQVFIVVGRIGSLPEELPYSDKNNMQYALQEIFSNFLSPFIVSECTIFEGSRFVWFLQPELMTDRFRKKNEAIEWKSVITFIKGSLETIQNTYKETLGIEMSFALSHGPACWNEVYREFEALKRVTSKRITDCQQRIIDLGMPNEFFKNEADKQAIDALCFHKKIKSLEKYLDEGEENEIEAICIETMKIVQEGIKNNFMVGIENYFSLLLVFITYINRNNLVESLSNDIHFEGLMILEIPDDWQKTERLLVALGRYLCMLQREQPEKEGNQIIVRLHKYIGENPGGNLSLTKLAELVYFNPSYLSRFYRQVTGQHLSEYINGVKLETAKTLLGDMNLKVNEVAFQLGFDSPSYFSAFIRKMTGVTPQDLRDTILHQQSVI